MPFQHCYMMLCTGTLLIINTDETVLAFDQLRSLPMTADNRQGVIPIRSQILAVPVNEESGVETEGCKVIQVNQGGELGHLVACGYFWNKCCSRLSEIAKRAW